MRHDLTISDMLYLIIRAFSSTTTPLIWKALTNARLYSSTGVLKRDGSYRLNTFNEKSCVLGLYAGSVYARCIWFFSVQIANPWHMHTLFDLIIYFYFMYLKFIHILVLRAFSDSLVLDSCGQRKFEMVLLSCRQLIAAVSIQYSVRKTNNNKFFNQLKH